MEIRHLRSFATAVRLGRVPWAAEALETTPSLVTSHIQALETELGVFLFFREGGVVRLTTEGEKLLPFAEGIVALAEQAGEAVRSPRVTCGPLQVGAPEVLTEHRLGAFLETFRQGHPHVTVNLCCPACREFLPALRQGTLDLALLLDRSVEDPDLEALDLGPEPQAFAVSPRHPLGGAPLTPSVLGGHTLLLGGTGSSCRDPLEACLEGQEVRPRVLALSRADAALELAREGGGVALVPRIALAGDLEAETLAELAWEGPELSLRAFLVRSRQRPFAAPARAFWEALAKHPWQEEAPEASLAGSDKAS